MADLWFPNIHVLKSKPPVHQNVIVFELGVVAHRSEILTTQEAEIAGSQLRLARAKA
jgi:hypothetical protein